MALSATNGAAGAGPTISILGGLSIEWSRRPVRLTLNGQRVVALLALRQSVQRCEIAGLLWPDVDDRRADGSLRTTLWRLNRDCPRLVTTGAELAISHEPVIDVRRLLLLSRRVATAPETIPLEDLIELGDYGELLPGWYDDWVLAERERIRQIWIHLLEDASEELLRRGRYTLALHQALRALVAEPLRESANRLVIRVHLAEGNTVEARRHYLACRRLLRSELGVDPSPQMQALMQHPDAQGSGKVGV